MEKVKIQDILEGKAPEWGFAEVEAPDEAVGKEELITVGDEELSGIEADLGDAPPSIKYLAQVIHDVTELEEYEVPSIFYHREGDTVKEYRVIGDRELGVRWMVGPTAWPTAWSQRESRYRRWAKQYEAWERRRAIEHQRWMARWKKKPRRPARRPRPVRYPYRPVTVTRKPTVTPKPPPKIEAPTITPVQVSIAAGGPQISGAGSGVLTIPYDGEYSFAYTGIRSVPANTEQAVLSMSGSGSVGYGIITFFSYAHNLRDLRFWLDNDGKRMEMSIYEVLTVSMHYGNPSGFFVEKFFEDVTWFNPSVTFTSHQGRFFYSIQIPSQKFRKLFELGIKNNYNDEIYVNAYVFYSVIAPSFNVFDVGQLDNILRGLIEQLKGIQLQIPEEIKVKLPEIKRQLFPQLELERSEKAAETPEETEEIMIAEEEKEEAPEVKKATSDLKKYLPLLAVAAAAVLGKEEGGT